MTGIWIGPMDATVSPSTAAGAPVSRPGTPDPERGIRVSQAQAQTQAQAQAQAQALAQSHPAPPGQIILDPAGATEGVQNVPGQQFRLSALDWVDAGLGEGFP
jgi:hypothetical protein